VAGRSPDWVDPSFRNKDGGKTSIDEGQSSINEPFCSNDGGQNSNDQGQSSDDEQKSLNDRGKNSKDGGKSSNDGGQTLIFSPFTYNNEHKSLVVAVLTLIDGTSTPIVGGETAINGVANLIFVRKNFAWYNIANAQHKSKP
jgi:hypothetical protein